MHTWARNPLIAGAILGLLVVAVILLTVGAEPFSRDPGPVDQCRLIVDQSDAARCAEQLMTAEAGQ